MPVDRWLTTLWETLRHNYANAEYWDYGELRKKRTKNKKEKSDVKLHELELYIENKSLTISGFQNTGQTIINQLDICRTQSRIQLNNFMKTPTKIVFGYP